MYAGMILALAAVQTPELDVAAFGRRLNGLEARVAALESRATASATTVTAFAPSRRRSVMAAVLNVPPVARAWTQSGGGHQHRCGACGTIFDHATAGPSHSCPACGNPGNTTIYGGGYGTVTVLDGAAYYGNHSGCGPSGCSSPPQRVGPIRRLFGRR